MMTQYIGQQRRFISVIIASLFILSSLSLQAEQFIRADGFNIHYNAFNSAMLTPEIANQYGIQRSSSLGVINISVLDATDQAVTAFIEGHVKNSISQLQELKFRKVVEGAAIYYIATFNFADKEKLLFNFYVVPKNETRSIKGSLSQQFFVG